MSKVDGFGREGLEPPDTWPMKGLRRYLQVITCDNITMEKMIRVMILSGAKQPVGSQPFTAVSLADRTDKKQVQPTRIREFLLCVFHI